MGYTLVSEAVQIEFQGFELYNVFIRDVAELYGRKVRVARARAETGKLRKTYIYIVVPVRGGIRPSFQFRL